MSLATTRLCKYLTYIVLLITVISLQFIHCDLQQASDAKIDLTKQDEAQQQDGDKAPESNVADPDYIKRELKDLIGRQIDADKSGLVSYEELKKYLAELHEKNIEHNVDKQWTVYSPQIHEVFSWEGYEPERKEVLTWDHYFNQTYPELIGVDVGIPINREQDSSRILNAPPEQQQHQKKPAESSSSSGKNQAQDKKANVKEDADGDGANIDPHMKTLKLMVERADARWKLADENGDTLLTKQEFKYLLHPDEGYEELQNLFVREATEDMDLDKDGKICLDEFMKHLQVLASEHERNDQNWLSSQQENFGRFLDKNKDGVLDGDEIKDWLVPAKSKKYETEAKRLLDIGDVNEDHSLSAAEILEHFEQYLSLLPPEYWQSGSAQESSDEEEVSQEAPPSAADELSHDEL